MRSVSSSWPTWVPSASAMASSSSWVFTDFSAASLVSLSNSSRLEPCASSASASLASSWSKPCTASCSTASISACTTFSGSGTSVFSSSASSTLSRISPACCTFFTRSTRLRRSAFSSSRVSNSEASWANSSSASGSSRSLTDCTVTVMTASLPACSPATSVEVNSLDSPADRPISASSRPSISCPEPTSWDRPVVDASGTSWPSTVADRSMETKSPSCTGRSTPVRVPKRWRSEFSCSSMSSSPMVKASTVTSRSA
ncbi:Uncharacterised protein [Mycobacteroides abscessus subsp. abscessus]|nr:Uncharacterised protein [Mycobacteroides abscessus subsp. abscessus]